MAALIALLETQLGLSWTDIVEWLREQNSLDVIEARLIERGISGVLLEEVETAAARYADDLHAAFTRAGERTAAVVDAQLDDALVRFEQTNYRAVARAEVNKYELVKGLSEESRTVVRRVVADGVEAGANPRVIARDIRDSIGLTDAQQQHVANYRRALEQADYSKAMGYELRDARSDKMLRRLDRDDGRLSGEQIDRMVERYRKNYVAYRAETIARTEALRAAHEGADELFLQAINRGDLELEQLESMWNAGPRTKHARDEHQAMDEQVQPFGEPFVAPDGTTLRYPGDPNAGARHTANCRCRKSTVIKAPAAAAAAA